MPDFRVYCQPPEREPAEIRLSLDETHHLVTVNRAPAGATVVDSVGMGHIMEDVPLFAGMRSLFRAARPRNNMIFSVINDSQAPEVMEVLDKILDCSHGKGQGIAVTLPIDSAIGVRGTP